MPAAKTKLDVHLAASSAAQALMALPDNSLDLDTQGLAQFELSGMDKKDYPFWKSQVTRLRGEFKGLANQPADSVAGVAPAPAAAAAKANTPPATNTAAQTAAAAAPAAKTA